MNRNRRLLLLALLGLTLSATAHAQIPRTITFQGILTDVAGNPLPPANYTIKITLMDALTGGTAVYSETQQLPVVQGTFNMIIGLTAPIPTTLAFDRPYWLAISVNGGSELQPRTPLTSVPYALHAGTADVAASLAPGATGVVTSINGQSGALTLVGGGSTTVTQSNGTVTITSAGGSGSGIAGVQNTDGTIDITNPNGPVATIGLANNAVTSAKIADGAVTIDDIASGVIPTIPTSLPPTGSAGGDLSGTYPNPSIADNAVTTARIANGAVTPGKIGTAGAGTGQSLIYDGSIVTWGNPSGLALPFSASASSASTAFALTNTGVGSVAQFTVNNASSTAEALRVLSNGGTALFAQSTGVGQAGYFRINNSGNSAASVYAETNGSGNSLQGFSSGSGSAVFGANNGTGRAGNFSIQSATNSSEVLYAMTTGTGRAGYFRVNNTASMASAIFAETNGSGGWFGPAGVYGKHTGNAGVGVYGEATGTSANGIPPRGVYGYSSNGRGVHGYSSSNYAVFGETDGTGKGVYGYTSGSAEAGYFTINNNQNAASAIVGETNGVGNVIRLNHTGGAGSIAVFQATGVNVARIDRAGRGYFNGGTQLNGADVAEAFSVEGATESYEPGDVLVISTESDRTMEKSSEAYSTLVAGVHATKPGVLLSERNVEASHDDMVPLGVIGVIPTKVCAENGPIRRGDLLVTSSTPGHAMRGSEEKLRVGVVLGKALEDFNGESTGTIRVLVNVK